MLRKGLAGWPLLWLWTVALTLICLPLGLLQADEEGMRQLIRLTARTSLLAFLLAFGAAAAYRHWPAAGTRWLLANRRYLGLAFVLSHAYHAIAILTLLRIAPETFAGKGLAAFAPQLLAYAFIVAMGLTSFERTAAWLGRRAWSLLHLVGGYYLLFSFLLAFGKRVPEQPLYLLAALPCLLVLGLRWWPVGRRAATAD